ncbi:polysaccharide biosynthesis C-terminal domain-containing protein [Staphylospora marina]|uniref:oligosaccharide flippase family protein n=1 Tax=Staphylospora marina TaxID=2490858 RepID=UPI000F5C1ACB|nr:polysaccharide biosynthesis C-terminal domain-containing protein [Staphylospora marina]
MRQHLKRLFSDSAVFAIATMGNKLVSAMLFPLYGLYLTSQGELADWGLTNTITLILTYLCILGTDAAMAFYFYDAKDVTERRLYFTNAVLFSGGLCLGLTLLITLVREPLTSLVYEKPHGYEFLLPVAFLATFGAILIQHILGYARYSRRVWLFNLFSMSYVIGSSLLSFWFLAEWNAGVMGLFYGQLVGQLLVAAILLVVFRNEFVWKFSPRHLKDLVRYGAPLLPTLMAFWVMSSVSRPILYHLDSIHNADIYEACMRLASIIVLITSPFQLAWRPFSMSIKDREDAPGLYSVIGRGLLVAGTLAIMLLTFFMQDIYALFTSNRQDLAEGYLYVWALSLGTLFNVLVNVFGVGLLIKKQTKLISRGFLIAAILYLAGNLLFVPVFHIWGAAGSTVAAYLFVIVWVYRQNQNHYPIPFKFGSVSAYLAVFLIAMAVVSWAQANRLDFLWAVEAAALGVTVAAVFATGLFSVRSLNRVGSLLPKLGGKG